MEEEIIEQQSDSKWYVLRVVSGKERKIKEYLDKDILRSGWAEIIKQVFLPMEKVYKVQNGKKVMREKNYFPGYVMLEVANGKLTDDIIQHISNISNINIDVVATSIASSTVSDPIRNQITALTAASSSSDLYNADQSGLGVGIVDNAGQPLRTVKVTSGKAVFPLVAKNNSTQANNYNLYASFSAIDVANIMPTTKTGFSVKFYEGDASCQTARRL